ncbi:MAG: hypothetical protein VZQ98_15450 [Bacteroidales bacterium]|nr:hypothetical protein [Bacteroidales bacterium]
MIDVFIISVLSASPISCTTEELINMDDMYNQIVAQINCLDTAKELIALSSNNQKSANRRNHPCKVKPVQPEMVGRIAEQVFKTSS